MGQSPKPEFSSYVTEYAMACRLSKTEGLPWPGAVADFYNKRISDEVLQPVCNDGGATGVTWASEMGWYAGNCPYYKLYPGLEEQFRHVALNVPVENFHLPHPEFVLLFSAKHAPPPYEEPVYAVLMTEVSQKIVTEMSTHKLLFDTEVVRDGTRLLVLIYQLQVKDGRRRTGLLRAVMHPGDTVDEAVAGERAILNKVQAHHGKSTEGLSVDQRIELFRLTLAACLVGTSQHELVMPDFTKRQLEKYDKASKQKDEKRMQRLRGKTTGWTIGRDIQLPNWAHKRASADDSVEGQKLSHRHLRRGHMRMQPYGSNLSLRKLIYVAPMWVRPDLPEGPARGYAIKTGS